MTEKYERIYKSFKTYICDKKPLETKEITREIKNFFMQEEINKLELSSRSKKEYLTDVNNMTFNPLEIIQVVNNNEFEVVPKEIKSLLSVESELGGASASSPTGVMRNVAEDFCKLLIINSEYKVMVFTSLKFKNENANTYIGERVNTLKEIYDRSNPLKDDNGILLIHIKGESDRPNSSQVQVKVNEKNISGYIIEPNRVKDIIE